MASRPKAEPSRLVRSLTGAYSNHRYEGHPLRMQVDQTESSKGFISFGVDISDAPVPQRRYAAELCSIQQRNGQLKLIFAQASLDDAGLDSALVVRLNPGAAKRMLASIDEMDSPGVAEIARLMHIEPEPLSDIHQRPQQMANVVANLAAIALSGYETCIDFYNASPFAMRDMQKTQELAVEPVVRVDIQTALFLSLIAGLRTVVASLPQQHIDQGV